MTRKTGSVLASSAVKIITPAPGAGGKTPMMRRQLALCLCLAALMAAGQSRALEVKDLSFYAPFDGSLNAAFASGAVAARVGEKQIPFVPGIAGQAVQLGEPKLSLSYAVSNNIGERQGSISMWVKPLWADWMTEHYFITISQNQPTGRSDSIPLDNRMSIWYSRNFCVCFTTPLWQLADYPCPFPDKKAEFHHIVITWGNGKSIRYGDGKFQAQIDLTGKLPPWDANNSQFEMGKAVTSDDRMAIDELMIFNRPLDATEANNLYRQVSNKLKRQGGGRLAG